MISRVKAPFPLDASAYACSLVECDSGLSGLRPVQAIAANAAYRPERFKWDPREEGWNMLIMLPSNVLASLYPVFSFIISKQLGQEIC